MNVTVNSQVLAEELRLINKIVATKSTIPIVMNVRLLADERLHFYATDFELGFSTSCAARISMPGEITLPAKKFLDIVEQFPNIDVHITLEHAHVLVEAGAFRTRIQTMNAAEFPTFPTVAGAVSLLHLTPFRLLIERAKYAIAEKSGKYVIDGALLVLRTATPATETEPARSPTAACVATDGKRLSLATMARDDSPEFEAIIPTKALDAVLALLPSGTVSFSSAGNHLFFVVGERVLYSRMIDGTFPKYERIIPRDCNKTAVIERTVLAAALRRVGLVADQNRATSFAFDGTSVTITASSADVGDAVERVPIVYSGTPQKISVDWTFMLDFLNVSTSQTVTIALKDANGALLLTDDTDFLNVVMCMRL